MPRGNTMMIGSVDSGQSMVRLTSTASLLLFHRIRVQASEDCQAMAKSVTNSAKLKNNGYWNCFFMASPRNVRDLAWCKTKWLEMLQGGKTDSHGDGTVCAFAGQLFRSLRAALLPNFCPARCSWRANASSGR